MMKAESEFTHFCDDQKNKCFVVYNVKDKSTTKYEVPYETVYLFDSVQIKNHIYFTGGGMPPAGTRGEQFFQKAVEIIITGDDTKVEELPKMNVGRSNHTLVAVADRFLYAIGGCNTKAEIPACEEYNIEERKWRPCASLNEKKMWVSVCVFSSRYLYAFGGSTNLKPKESDLIECLDTEDKGAKMWTKVELAAGKEIWPRCFFVGCFQIEPDSILLFGGLVNSNEVDDTYYFNPTKKTMEKGQKLERKDAFYRTKPGINGKEMTIVGSNEGDMHIYNITDKKWSLLKKNMWNPETGFNIKSDTV